MKQAPRHLKRRLVPMRRLVLPQAESQLSRPQARVLPQAQQVLQQGRVLPQARVSPQAQQVLQQAQQQQPQKLQLSAVGSALQQAR